MELKKLISLLDKDTRITVLNSRSQIVTNGYVGEYNGAHENNEVTRLAVVDNVLEITTES